MTVARELRKSSHLSLKSAPWGRNLQVFFAHVVPYIGNGGGSLAFNMVVLKIAKVSKTN